MSKINLEKDVLTLQKEGANLVRHHQPAILVDKDGQLWVAVGKGKNTCLPVPVADLDDTLSEVRHK